jgi:hypothetical protein
MRCQNQTVPSQVVEFLEVALEENAEMRDTNSLLTSKPIMSIDNACIQSIYILLCCIQVFVGLKRCPFIGCMGESIFEIEIEFLDKTKLNINH